MKSRIGLFVLVGAVMAVQVLGQTNGNSSGDEGAKLRFINLSYPDATSTGTYGINNHGEIVGSYTLTPPTHAMRINCMNAVPFGCKQYVPLSPISVFGTRLSVAVKNNDRGEVVGIIGGDDGFTHGFLLDGGELTILDFPGASDTYPYGINDSGVVVGTWDLLDSQGNTIFGHGFVWKDGQFSDIVFPGSFDTTVRGINSRGDFVGQWDTGVNSNSDQPAFVFTNGQFISFLAPGSTWTQANDINDAGHIVGSYVDAQGVLHGFQSVGARFRTVDYPNAAGSVLWGTNNTDVAIGNHYDSMGNRAGFAVRLARSDDNMN